MPGSQVELAALEEAAKSGRRPSFVSQGFFFTV